MWLRILLIYKAKSHAQLPIHHEKLQVGHVKFSVLDVNNEHYSFRKGDKIFLFGFSRGGEYFSSNFELTNFGMSCLAHTARVVAGMLYKVPSFKNSLHI